MFKYQTIQFCKTQHLMIVLLCSPPSPAAAHGPLVQLTCRYCHSTGVLLKYAQQTHAGKAAASPGYCVIGITLWQLQEQRRIAFKEQHHSIELQDT
jgi:hypothetical protein